MKKYFIIIGIALLLSFSLHLSASTPSKDASSSTKETIENKIQLAENYYLLTLDEGIGTLAQKKSKRFLQESKELLENSSLSEDDKQTYLLQLNTIEKELNDYVSIEYHTLEGYFPLLRYTASSFFFSPEESEVHTLMKNPNFVAVKNATNALVSSLSAPGEVVFNSNPNDSKLEKLSFSIFNNDSDLSSHMDKDVVSVLNDKKLIEDFRKNNITSEISTKLFEAFSGNPLYIVTIDKELSDGDERFYTLNASFYNKDGYSEEKSTSSSAYAVDERSNWIGIIGIHLFFLMLAFAFAYFHERKVEAKTYSMTFIFYLFGRIFPLIIVPTIMAFKPDDDIHVIYSSWWIFVLGVTVFILPIIAIKMFYGKLTNYIPLPDIGGKGELVGFSIAAGTLSFLAVPYIFSFGNTLNFINILAFIMLSISVLFSGYVTGKVLDDNDKMDEKNLIIFIFTSVLIMAAFLHGVSAYLIAASLVALLVAAMVLYLHNNIVKKEIKENNKFAIEEEITSDIECSNIENVDLRDISLNPPYQKFDYYNRVFNHTKTIFDGKSTYSVLKGDGGAGKTATANVLIESIGSELTVKNQPVLFLSSVCERNDGSEVPYSMFHSLLDSTLNMDLFGQREKDEKFDNVVNMASRFMMGPVASFLASDSSGEQKAFSKRDIYIFVKKKFSELSTNSTLIILIDDVQWIDGASKELLKYLMEEYEAGSNHKILFVLTVRDTEEGNQVIGNLHLLESTYSIGFVDRSEQRQLLEKSFCISPSSTQWIVNWASEQNSNKIYPYILVDTVGNLVRSDVFVIENNRFAIKEDFNFDNPPIPDGPQKEIKLFMNNYPQYREVLSFAAMFGKEFTVSNISYGLDISYLETVRMLDAISKEGGLIFDLLDKDDAYQFRSQIILDAVRSNISYSSEGIQSTQVPQAIRHFHALAANSLKNTKKSDHSSKLIMAIANHYYAAGKLYTDEAIDYLLQAASSCRKLFEYDDALEYLNKEDEVLSLTNKNTLKSEALRLLIECDRSNVQGINADKAAIKTLEYIDKYQDCVDELKMAATRACYDSALQNNYSQEWFGKSAEVAEKYLLTSSSKLMQAEGYHFIAISMKPQNEEEKQKQLEYYNQAITLTKDDYPTAYAKIANSLAETLSYGDSESKIRAKNLFTESLLIKENADIKDLPGIARTYGGLGRLAFFSSPPKIEEAREYFQKDLDIAKEINDQRGISQMNSFLGSCCKTEESYEEAIVFYDESIHLENNPFDVHASYDGKFFSLGKLNNQEKVIDTADTYLEVVKKLGTPPPFLAKNIIASLERYSGNKSCQNIIESLKANE